MLFFPCYYSPFSQSISDSCISSLLFLTRTPVDVSSPCLLVENLLGFNGYCCCWLISGDLTAPYLLRGGDFLSPLKVSVVVALYCWPSLGEKEDASTFWVKIETNSTLHSVQQELLGGSYPAAQQWIRGVHTVSGKHGPGKSGSSGSEAWIAGGELSSEGITFIFGARWPPW